MRQGDVRSVVPKNLSPASLCVLILDNWDETVIPNLMNYKKNLLFQKWIEASNMMIIEYQNIQYAF
jgi:hypothetical protein